MMSMPMASPGAAGAATSFVMWGGMMVAMMLPSLLPMLWRYRKAVRSTVEARRAELTALVACGYFAMWAAFGLALYLGGLAIGALEIQLPALRRAAPLAVGVFVILIGLHQLSTWKMHHLACCRATPVEGNSTWSVSGALMHGVRHGIHCVCDCGPVMALLVVLGAMDLRAMALVTAATTVERLAPDELRSAVGAPEQRVSRQRAPGRRGTTVSALS